MSIFENILFAPSLFFQGLKEISKKEEPQTPPTPTPTPTPQIRVIDKKQLLIEQQKRELKKLKEDLELKDYMLKRKQFKEHREAVAKKEKEKELKRINRDTLANIKYLKPNTLQYVLGHTEEGKLIIQNISDEPHVLISGKTGSGKSVTMFNLLISICNINTPQTLEISLIDPKMLSFGDKRIVKNKFLKEKPSIFDSAQALYILQNAYDGMMKRYKKMLKAGVKDYREIGLKAHVIFIDEVFELLEEKEGKEILQLITRIASLGRAGGVHLVMATQSPRAKTLGGTLKANLSFIGHKASNPTESKLIELMDAHKLKGKGDGLRVLQNTSDIVRFQATYLDENSDKTYSCFAIESHKNSPKTTQNTLTHTNTQNRPKTDPTRPKMYPTQNTQNTQHTPQNKGVEELTNRLLNNIDLNGFLPPKKEVINIKKRDELKIYNSAIKTLKDKNKIEYKNGIGYKII